MEIAITGAGGLIGSALARSLRADGHVVRRSSARRRALPDPARSTGNPAATRSSRMPSRGSTPWCTSPAPGSGTGAGRRVQARGPRHPGTGHRPAGPHVGGAVPPADRVRLRPPAWASTATGATRCSPRRGPRRGRTSSPGWCRRGRRRAQPAVDAGIRTVMFRNGVVLSRDGGVLARLVAAVPALRRRAAGLGRSVAELGVDRRRGGCHSCSCSTRRHLGAGERDRPGPGHQRRVHQGPGGALHRPTVVPVPAFGPRLVLGREMADELLFFSQRVEPARLRRRLPVPPPRRHDRPPGPGRRSAVDRTRRADGRRGCCQGGGL